MFEAFSCTASKAGSPFAAKSPELTKVSRTRDISSTIESPGQLSDAEQADHAAVGSTPAPRKRNKRSPAAVPSTSPAKRQKQKPDLTQAPGVPARLGARPLRLIIVGANPSEHAWLSGHYYSNPGNWMWRILKDTGIAPSSICGSQDDGRMQEAAGVGFIDVGVGHPCTQLSAISTETFQSWIETFYRHLKEHVQQACRSIGCTCGKCGCPAVVAFSGKRQFMELMNHRRPKRDRLKKLDTGLQTAGPDGWPLPCTTELWVMTSTSGASPMTNEQRYATWKALAAVLEKLEHPCQTSCPGLPTGSTRRLLVMSQQHPDKPRSLISADSVGTHHYLELQVLLGKTATSFLQPVSFFVSWQGVLTLAYRGFPPPVANLKRQIDASHPGLDKENPGSLWPKTSLGALKDDKRLTPDQLKALNAICERESVIFTAGDDALRVRMDTAGVALYECRSCEKLLAYQECKLDSEVDPSEATVEEQGRVQQILVEALDPNYWFSVSKDGNRETHYRGPHLGASLIHKLRSGSPAGNTNRNGHAHAILFGTINHFRKKVEEELPGLYAWFSDESLHVTFRALMG